MHLMVFGYRPGEFVREYALFGVQEQCVEMLGVKAVCCFEYGMVVENYGVGVAVYIGEMPDLMRLNKRFVIMLLDGVGIEMANMRAFNVAPHYAHGALRARFVQHDHKLGLFEHLHVMNRRRLGYAERLRNFRYSQKVRAVLQKPQYIEPDAIGKSLARRANFRQVIIVIQIKEVISPIVDNNFIRHNKSPRSRIHIPQIRSFVNSLIFDRLFNPFPARAVKRAQVKLQSLTQFFINDLCVELQKGLRF